MKRALPNTTPSRSARGATRSRRARNRAVRRTSRSAKASLTSAQEAAAKARGQWAARTPPVPRAAGSLAAVRGAAVHKLRLDVGLQRGRQPRKSIAYEASALRPVPVDIGGP